MLIYFHFFIAGEQFRYLLNDVLQAISLLDKYS